MQLSSWNVNQALLSGIYSEVWKAQFKAVWFRHVWDQMRAVKQVKPEGRWDELTGWDTLESAKYCFWHRLLSSAVFWLSLKINPSSAALSFLLSFWERFKSPRHDCSLPGSVYIELHTTIRMKSGRGNSITISPWSWSDTLESGSSERNRHISVWGD